MKVNTSQPARPLTHRLRWAVLPVLAVLTCAPAPAVGARPGPGPPLALPADRTTPVRLRQPAPARLRAFRQQTEFQYVEPVAAETSAWSLFWRQLREWLAGLFARPGYRYGGRYAVYAAFGLAFLYVLLRVLQLDFTNVFGRTARPLPLHYEASTEDIHGIDFTTRLTEAEAVGNYRLAVRLGYLLVLHTLTTRHLIDWQPEKTNHDYLQQLTNTPWQTGFATLTRQFEYVWYGEQRLTAGSYAPVREARQQFLDVLFHPAA
ncbi:DUF4129 domain-containing protein [Hymenobacter algoricola]|uniref:DUF4129 domain-containing protein n=1 Tax=Hymenobacter algoricola TaxID=486267 RepID=A0ABP7NLB7_9BACT